MEKHNQYFEGILQLRNPSKEVADFIEKNIKERDGVFITRRENVVNGTDFYMTSNAHLKRLGRLLQKRFGGELKISPRLFSKNRQTSKGIYRLNVLFRLHKHKKGDIIEIRGEKIKVLSIGKKIVGRELSTGKKVTVGYEKLRAT